LSFCPALKGGLVEVAGFCPEPAGLVDEFATELFEFEID